MKHRDARLVWAALCIFIVRESLGQWRTDGPGIWAPLLISYHDIAENVAVYVAFGALAVASLGNERQRHYLRRSLKICMLAVLFSALNETLQLYTVDRVASVTDIASAAIGSFSGAAVFGWLVAQ